MVKSSTTWWTNIKLKIEPSSPKENLSIKECISYVWKLHSATKRTLSITRNKSKFRVIMDSIYLFLVVETSFHRIARNGIRSTPVLLTSNEGYATKENNVG